MDSTDDVTGILNSGMDIPNQVPGTIVIVISVYTKTFYKV